MADFADFDPLVSPVTNGSASSTGGSGSAGKAAASNKSPADGDAFLYSGWRPLTNNEHYSYSLTFHPGSTSSQSDSSHGEEDAVLKIQREKEEKDAQEREKVEKERRAEKERQEEAIAAAAAGKELIAEDIVKVELPDPSVSGGAIPRAATPPPVDPEILKHAAELQKVTEQHEKEERERTRYLGKRHFRFTRLSNNDDTKGIEYQGLVQLRGKSIILEDITKRTVNQQATEQPRTEVPGVSTRIKDKQLIHLTRRQWLSAKSRRPMSNQSFTHTVSSTLIGLPFLPFFLLLFLVFHLKCECRR